MYKILDELNKDKRAIRDIVRDKLIEQMEADERVCYLDADLMNCIGTRSLSRCSRAARSTAELPRPIWWALLPA